MKEKVFLREIKTLIYYIREYGIRHIDFTLENVNSLIEDEEKKHKFYYHCHQGFYAAQDRVIYLLRKILQEKKKLKTELKIARGQRIKEDIESIEYKIKRLEFQENVLRKIMDAIAWQIFGYDLSVMRRLYCGNPTVDITNSNLESELFFIENCKKNYSNTFVLINDLTSFIQIGDVVMLNDNNKKCIYELKEGDVNEELFRIIEDVSKTQCLEHLSKELKDKDKVFVKQFERAVKQTIKVYQTKQTINRGYGIDHNTGQRVKISDVLVEIDYYFDKLNDLCQECNKKGYAISVIEGCLLVGVYDVSKHPSKSFEAWNEMLKIETPIYDLRNSFYDPLSYPLFLHSFSDTFIVDLIAGKKVIKLSLDIKKWLSTFEKDGYKVNWLSKKETNIRNTSLKGANRIFEIKGHGIEIEKDGIKQTLCGGIFSRMFTHFATPSSAKKVLFTMNELSVTNE